MVLGRNWVAKQRTKPDLAHSAPDALPPPARPDVETKQRVVVGVVEALLEQELHGAPMPKPLDMEKTSAQRHGTKMRHDRWKPQIRQGRQEVIAHMGAPTTRAIPRASVT